MWNLLEIVEWINSCIKRLIGNVNSASEIKLLSNQKPQEIDAQQQTNFICQKKKKKKKIKKHEILVINDIDILVRT